MLRFRHLSPIRRAATPLVYLVGLAVVACVLAAAIDLGRVVIVRTQLQTAADAAALAAAGALGRSPELSVAAARQSGGFHTVAGRPVSVAEGDVEFGVWDLERRTFTPTVEAGNAVRVTARRSEEGAALASVLLLGRLAPRFMLQPKASAVAMARPRDIALVVDLSGSMNDDTEPYRALAAGDGRWSADGRAAVGSELLEQLYADFGFGEYPGPSEWIGQPLPSVANNRWAYAEMTKDNGPLAAANVAECYRILPADSETVRKEKAYRWMIDEQIARLMPNAQPAPAAVNYPYWEKYLDYLICPVTIGTLNGGSLVDGPSLTLLRAAGLQPALPLGLNLSKAGLPPGGPPYQRGTLPPNQDPRRITSFDNLLERDGLAGARPAPGYRNMIGYRTYLQFMLDLGRDRAPLAGHYSPLSKFSSACPYHYESTPGGMFRFPPREQPLHSARRALIAALAEIKHHNGVVPDLNQRDWVAVVRFDALDNGGPVLEQTLTSNYDAAMQACTTLQAAGDVGATSAIDAGLQLARRHLRAATDAGAGRANASKVVVLLTVGRPNLHLAGREVIDRQIAGHGGGEFYCNGSYARDAALLEVQRMQAEGWLVVPLAVGANADYDFLGRVARLGGATHLVRCCAQGDSTPAEARLVAILREIIGTPQIRLVE